MRCFGEKDLMTTTTAIAAVDWQSTTYVTATHKNTRDYTIKWMLLYVQTWHNVIKSYQQDTTVSNQTSHKVMKPHWQDMVEPQTHEKSRDKSGANAQRDGRPAKYRWRPLFKVAKFGWCPLLKCRAVTLPRLETRWNLQGCPKLLNQSQPLVSQSSPNYEDMWRKY